MLPGASEGDPRVRVCCHYWASYLEREREQGARGNEDGNGVRVGTKTGTRVELFTVLQWEKR